MTTARIHRSPTTPSSRASKPGRAASKAPRGGANGHKGRENSSSGAESTTAAGNGRSAEILDAATAIFAREGYRNTDVQIIADAVGVGKGTIYRHFPTKRELFLAAADRGMRLLHDEVEAALQGHADALEQIRAAIGAYLAFFSRHPEHVELLIQERAEFRDRPTPTYFAHRQENLARWQETYRKLIAAGRVRDIPVERITDVMSGLVYGTMFISFFTGRQMSADEQADQILDVVFNGILTASEKTARRTKKDGER